MEEEIEFIIDAAQESMGKVLVHLEKKYTTIRAGNASPAPLNQVSNINTPDGMTITVQPFEKSLISEIEKGIMLANLGFNPMNNGENVIISVPPLTEERRRELAKQAKAEAEDAKVRVRNERKSANNELKALDISEDLKKNLEMDVQELTDKHIQKIDQIFSNKEAEIMKV